MPPRIARSSVQIAAPKSARNKNRKRNLDAFAIASHALPTKSAVRQNRLGEFLDDGPKQKRRRVVQLDDEEEIVEEEIPAKPRRPAGIEDGLDQGSDSEGNEWTLGGLREDDEDSDLDSDEAFGESDEERFAGFTFRGSSSGKSKRPAKRKALDVDEGEPDGIDLDENEEEDDGEEDDFGDDGVDLATMLDDEDEEMLGGKDNTAQDMGDDSGSMDDENDQEDTASESSSEGETGDGHAEQERIARMRDRLDALDPATPETPKPKVASGLTVDDLLEAAGGHSAKKQLAKSRKNAQPIPAPLPQRQQDRLNREVASKKAKEQVGRYQDTVIQNRRAEFLSFPLLDPNRSEPLGKENFVDNGAPRNELESNIRRIMEESGMVSQTADEEDVILKSEGMPTVKKTAEEVAKNLAELQKNRHLLFKEERRAKRIAKIKSKSYRRVHRREKAREREMMGLDEPDEDERERADRRRAEERMSTKHKDSKWAKSLKASNRTVWDVDARDSVNEQARRNEDLKRRIAGQASDRDDGSDSSSEEEAHDEAGDENQRTLSKLNRIRDDGQGDQEGEGLAGLKFMRSAEERRRRQNDEDVERLRKEMAVEDGDEEEEDDEVAEDQSLGRAVFGPKGRGQQPPAKKPGRPALEEGDASEEDVDNENEIEVLTEQPRRLKGVARPPVQAHSNSRGSTLAVPDTTSSWFTAPHKSSRRGKGARAEVNDGSVIELDPSARSITNEERSLKNRSNADAPNIDGWTTVTQKDTDHEGSNDIDHDSDHEPSDPILAAQSKSLEYQRRGFAADDVKAAFDTEKAEAVVSEDEKELSNHLPGWGSWTGEGLSKSVRKANTRQRHNPLYKTKLAGVKAEDRKDAKLENVLISEKLDRKGQKYKADILPHGYERKEQYERSLRVPMGPEWVTKETFQRNTRPRVVVKPGKVIAAMERPLV